MQTVNQETGEILVLSGYRVLELGDNAIFCGKLLTDLGAEIIKVEIPGGDAARNLAPFYKEVPHPERSLFWLSYNTSKKSITLSLKPESTEGHGWTA